MRRCRTFVALLCIAAIAAGVFVPADGAHGVLAFLAPVWLEFQPEDVVVVVPLEAARLSERLVALRALPVFRGPPAPVSA